VLVLDTNALLAILTRPKILGTKTTKLVASTETLFYSSISVFEIAIKNMLGKLNLSIPLPQLLDTPQLKSVAFNVEEALETYSLPSLSRHEPFDRMILATVKANRAKLITSDRKMLELGFDWILDSHK
jgi:PIN domain nuclease of toxin-antitoxin system